MEYSPQTPGDSKDSPKPLPSIPAARKAMINRVVVDAIDAYEDAHRRYKAYDEAIADDGALEKLTGLAFEHLEAARNNLVRALLAKDLDLNWGEVRHIERTVQKTCGVVHGGRMYQASVISHYTDAAIGDKPAHRDEPIMKLVVSDMASVPELGEPTPADDDQAEDLDESKPAPRHGTARREIPRPLLRQTMTICPPWDPTGMATVEIIALADGVHLDDETAGELDLPILREAGWHCLSGTPISLYARFIV